MYNGKVDQNVTDLTSQAPKHNQVGEYAIFFGFREECKAQFSFILPIISENLDQISIPQITAQITAQSSDILLFTCYNENRICNDIWLHACFLYFIKDFNRFH